jgi:hypothetical protein
MTSKITVAAAVALAAIVAVPSASFAASKAKNSHRYDVTKCEGGGCTALNPDRDFLNTSRNAQFYRSTHKKHKAQPKN